MAEETQDKPSGSAGEKAPSPLPEHVRQAAEAMRQGLREVTGGKPATPADHAHPPHSPAKPEESDGSNEPGRSRSPGQISSTFSQKLEQLKEMVHRFEPPDYCPKPMEPDGP